MQIRRFTQQQVFQWIGCGLRFWKRKPLSWLVAGLLMATICLAILQIPFVGVFFLALAMPAFYASMFDALTRQLDPAKSDATHKPLSPWFVVNSVFGAFVTEQGALVLLIPGMVAFALALFTQSVLNVISGPYTSFDVSLTDLGALSLLRLFGGYLLAYLAYVVLATVYFYVVPLCLRDNVSVKAALVGGVRIALKNVVPISVLLSVLFLPLLLGTILLQFLPIAGLLVWLVAGAILFPLFVHCAYCGNRLTFVNPVK